MRWLAVLVSLLGLSMAQTWYYEDRTFSPDTVYFIPTAMEQACAAVYNPEPGDGPLSVDLTSLFSACGPPPVVVWGSANGEKIRAVNLRVHFWGDKTLDDPDYGVDALMKVIESFYNFRVWAFGDTDQVDSQYLPPFRKPPVLEPPASQTGWKNWVFAQNIPLLQAQVQNEVQYNENKPSPGYKCENFREFDGDAECWSADLIWALPVRLVLHGGESGQYLIQIMPAPFRPFREKSTATTLSVRRGKLRKQTPKLLPFEDK